MDSTFMQNGLRQGGSDGLEFGMTYFNQESKGKRLSKVVSRSRSDTTTSTSSLDSPPSSTSSPKHMSRRISLGYDDGVSSTFPQQPESRASRSFFSKGGWALKRQGSKFSLLTVTEDSSEESAKFSLTRPDTFRTRSKSASRQNPALRKVISHPFDFQHLVHTDREVIRKLEEVEQGQKESQYLASSPDSPTLLIENQPPNSLSDHLAATDNLASILGDLEYLPISSPPPPPPPRSQNRPRTSSNSEFTPGFRASRSIENFSRPAQRSPTMQSPQSNRVSFHNAALITEIAEHSILDLDVSNNDSQDSAPIHLSTSGQMPVGNAVTTYDDSARVIKSKPLPPLHKPLPSIRDAELPPLPEETESIGSRTPTPDCARPTTARSSLRHSRSSPGLLMAADHSSFLAESPPLTNKRGTIFFEDPLPTIGTPSQTVSRPQMVEGCSRFSIGIFKPINVESWEEDIDYCYEHAAEADCDFEWGRRSQELSRSLETVTEIHRAGQPRVNLDDATVESPTMKLETTQLRSPISSKALKLCGLGPPADERLRPLSDLPDLDNRSADSSSTYKGALTPGFLHDDRNPSSALPMASPIEREHQPKIYTQEQLGDEVEDLYSGLLGDSHHDDATLHMCSDLAPALPKSSFDLDRRSQSSMGGRYNYYRDSFCLPQGLSTLKGGYHRSVNSESSVPGLDHSQTSSREFNPDMGLPSSARQSIISLTHFPSTSKLSYMSTPSLTSGGTVSTPGTSLREQISVEEMQPNEQLTMETCTSQSVVPVSVEVSTNTAQLSRPTSPSDILPTTGSILTHHGCPSISEVSDGFSVGVSGNTSSIPSFAARMRSGSNATFPSSPPPPASKPIPKRTSSRVSYSLFPTGTAAALRSPPMSPPVTPPVGNFI